MQFPLHMSFKIMSLSPKIYVTDATGAPVFFVKQKMFKLKEDIRVFESETQSTELACIKADRIIDFSATYNFSDHDDPNLGAVRRKGWRSIFKTHFEVLDENNEHQLDIREDNAMVKVLDALVGGIPFIGFLLMMMINPTYTVSTLDGTPLYQLKKLPAFFEGKFELHKIAHTVDEDTEKRSILAVMMMTLLERAKG